MSHSFSPKVITGNHLTDGDVIYLTATGDWTRKLSKAAIFDSEGHAKLMLLDAETRTNEVVGPYLADVTPGPDGPAPTHFREAFRSVGPSNYFHGKQAEV